MAPEHPPIDDPEFGTLVRATTDMSDGTVLTHDWYAGTVETAGEPLDLMVEGTHAGSASALLPRLRTVVGDLDAWRRRASDAVVTAFSQGDPESHELEAAASDLQLETIEASEDGTIVLHLVDECGDHFPEGYWPAVHIEPDDTISQVTVES